MKKLILVFLALVAFLAPASTQIEIQSVTAKQDTQNGVVDVAVTLQGEVSDVAKVECSFVAVNVENGAAVPIEHITRSGDDEVAGGVWTRKFVWDAKNDVGMVKIDDVALTITVKMSGSLGCVQLWENGPYWADCNVGATKPEECGYYFWWGDTVGYVRNENNKGWISVSDLTGFSFSFGNCPTYDKTISQLCSLGYVDAEGILNPLHDAATSHLGAPWRMPTDAEIVSLISSCDTEWTTRNGVAGRLVKGRGAYSAKSIFLPAAGHGDGSSLNGLGKTGYYWSSTPYSRDYAWYLKFYSVYFYHESDRTWGEDRYTIDGSDPVSNGVKYVQKFSIRGKTTVRAVGYYNGVVATKELVSQYGSGIVDAPVITASQEVFNFSKNRISISCATPNVEIHFTTDGTEPTALSPIYSVPFTIDETTTLKAVAIGHPDYIDSEVVTRQFTRTWLTVPTPVISPGDGGVFDTVKGIVSIGCDIDGVTIYFTTDGSKPSRTSDVYCGQIEIDDDTTILAYAVKDDYLDSPVVKATIYNRQPYAETPVVSLAGGGSSFVGSFGSVVMMSATDGAAIHYTLDGTDPNEHSPIYSGPVSIVNTTIVKAYASKVGCRNSAVKTTTFKKQWAYGDSLNCPDIMFKSEGGDWVNDPNVSYDGKGSLRSPLNPQDGKEYSFSTEVSGVRLISFYWKTSCEKDEWDEFYYDHAEFWVDDELVAQLDGNGTGWQYVAHELDDDNEHVLTWLYVKDYSGAVDGDCVWIDCVGIGEPISFCRVTFDYNDGSGKTTSETYVKGQSVNALPFASRDDFVFDGWFSHPYNGERISVPMNISHDMTVYARWTPVYVERNWDYTLWQYDRNVGLEVTIWGVSPKEGHLLIPEEIDGHPVTRLGYGAFSSFGHFDDIKSVSIPGSLKSIGEDAFACCSAVQSVQLPHALTNIEATAFYDSGLLDISIPGGVSEIGDYAFSECRALTNVVIEPGVLRIGEGVFEECWHLTAVVMPLTLTCIGDRAFYDCFAMLESITIPKNVDEIGSKAFANCNNLTNVCFDGKPPERIGSDLFLNVNCTIFVYQGKGWDEFVTQGSWQGVPIKYRQADVDRYDQVLIPGADTKIEIDKSWHGQYSDFEKKFGVDILAAYLKETGKHDLSGNPMYVWQDYVAGTDPTDVNSVFKARITIVDGKPKVEWEPNLNENGVVREYKVFGKESLTDAEWQSPISDQCKFFKVEVSMPK